MSPCVVLVTYCPAKENVLSALVLLSLGLALLECHCQPDTGPERPLESTWRIGICADVEFLGRPQPSFDIEHQGQALPEVHRG